MAEEEKEKTEAAPAPKKSKKPLIIIVSVVAVLLAIGIPTTIFLINKNKEPVDQVGPDAAKPTEEIVPESFEEEDELEEGEKPLGALFPLETFVVNLTGGRYIRCQLQVEFADRAVPKRFYNRLIPVRDAIITILIQKNAEDLISAKGKDTLRAEIKDSINELLRKQEVNNVYFTQYVVQ